MVDVRLERTGETETYAEALAQVHGYIARLAGTSLIVQASAGRLDGWSFIATGWLPVDEALMLFGRKVCVG